MKQLLSLLLLGTSLLTAGCKKGTPEPDLLLGRWNAESTKALNYSAAGQLESQDVEVTKDYHMVITPDLISYSADLDDSNWGRFPYTRQGNEIRYSSSQITIIELTPHGLTLRFKDPAQKPNMPYQEVEEHYSR
jgi:hypothetical protein